MKKLVVFLIVLIFSLSTISASIAGKNDKRNQRRGGDEYNQHQRYDNRGGNHWNRNYKKHPRRSYHHKQYRHRNYYNRGHWNRHDWNRHYNKNRHKYRSGKYYRQNGFLTFSFCEREGVCFSFSIDN